jgi:hypothetical protein
MNDDIMARLKRGEIVAVGNKMYMICRDCGKIIQINKPIVGSLHFCE